MLQHAGAEGKIVDTMPASLSHTFASPDPPSLHGAQGSREKNGAVYTKSWVVDLILDLAGYKAEADLVEIFAIEPAAGDGAFLLSMSRRLIASCRRQGRHPLECRRSLLAYELDEPSAARARCAVIQALADERVPVGEAEELASEWVRRGDYLLDAPKLPQADYVIGNPPYIRMEDMCDAGAAYRVLYPTMKGRADIYVAFFEAALRQLKPNGVCAYICADRWMLNQYGSGLRRLISQGYGVEAVIEMHDADAFEREVLAYPAIVVIRRGQQGSAVVAKVGTEFEHAVSGSVAARLVAIREGGDSRDAPSVEGAKGQVATIQVKAARTEDWFRDGDPWPCVSPDRLALLKRLEAEFYPLESGDTATKVGIGVATGADNLFITTDPELVEPDRLLPLAMAYDTFTGDLCWSGHYLVDPWTRDGLVDLSHYPRLAAYYGRHEEALRSRNVGRRRPDQWYRTIDRVNHALTGKRKLYIPDIKSRIHPVLDDGVTYPHHNLYYVQSDCWDVEVLGGLLLSGVAQFFIECYAVRMASGFLRFQAQYLRRIRVPRPCDLSSAQAGGLASAFRDRDVELATQVASEVYRIDVLPKEDPDGYVSSQIRMLLRMRFE